MRKHLLDGLDLSDPAILAQCDLNEPKRLFPVVFGRELSAGVLGWARLNRDAKTIVRRYDFETNGFVGVQRSYGALLIRTLTNGRPVLLVCRKSDIGHVGMSDEFWENRGAIVASSHDQGWDHDYDHAYH